MNKKQQRVQRKLPRGKKKERKEKEDEELKKQEAERLRLIGSTTDQQTSDPIDTQGVQDQDCLDSQEPTTTADNSLG